MKGWAARWRVNGRKRNPKEYAVNTELWGRLLDLCRTHDVILEWVGGHAGHAENERCDVLAVAEANAADLPADEVHERMLAERASQPSLLD